MVEPPIKYLDHQYARRKLEEMVAIPSVVGEESELAHYLEEELKALGLETELHQVSPGRPNVYARLEGTKPGRKLNLNGHTDTVPVVQGWETDPFQPTVKGDRLHGLGACDMKGGIACALAALKAYADASPGFKGELSFSGVVDEEAMGTGAKAMLETRWSRVDGIILGEPYTATPENPTPLGITGKILYDIHVHGKAAHAFNPEAGINAIEQAGIILANLPKLKVGSHQGFQGNYSTLKIEGGYQRYSVVVPEHCRFEVNRLTVPGETREQLIADMESLVESLGLEAKTTVTIKPPYYAPYKMDRENPLVQAFHQAYTETTGHQPHYTHSSSITDANTFMGEGNIPCIHLGPHPGGPHQANEYTTLTSLKTTAEIYVRLIAEFLQ